MLGGQAVTPSGPDVRKPVAMLATLARGLLKLLVAVALFLGTLEIYLAVWPETLPPRLGNFAFSKYGSFPGGIYFHDPVTGINFFKPSFETEAYFNGYRWLHRTDRLGFRNPPELEERRVLLLGDSLIYGHGVEEVDTVAHRLRADHGIAAYNMARQGDCIYQSYVLVRLYADPPRPALRPDRVVLFVFLNDFHDVVTYRDREAIRSRPEADWDYRAMRSRLTELAEQTDLHPRLLLGLSSLRLLRGLAGRLPALAPVRSAEAAQPGPPSLGGEPAPLEGRDPEAELPYLGTMLDAAFFTRVAGYYEATLADLHRRLAASGSGLHVVHLRFDRDLGAEWGEASSRLSSFLAGACRRLALDCHSTEDLFTDCAACFLPGDGHLSPDGHRRLAAWLAVRLAESTSAPALEG